MATILHKKISREMDEVRRDGRKFRPYIVSLVPGGLIEFRLKGTRKKEHLPVVVGYEMAVRLRVAQEKHAKKAARKARQEGRA